MQQIGFLLQNLLFTQHVSGTIMPIIRSSRVIQMVAACGTWHFGLQVIGLMWSCGLCVRFSGCCSSSILQTVHVTQGTMEKIPSDTTGNRSRDRPTSSAAP